MKTFFRFINDAIIVISLCLITISCNKHESLFDLPKGKLMLNVSMSIIEDDIGSTLKSTSIEDYLVKIFIKGESQALATFSHASEMPDELELPIGEYYATASNESNPAAAFESPYYYGQSADFEINEGKTSEVQITCSLANIMVSVVYSDNVKNSFSDFNSIVSNSEGNLTFSKNETRKGYFNSGPLAIKSTLEHNGNSKILNGEISNPQKGKHYEIRIDADALEGSSSVSIQLNEDFETEIIILNDDNSTEGDSEQTDTEDISFGDLLITEIMHNPAAMSDTQGEWFEIYNNSENMINLNGLVIRRGSNNNFRQINVDVQLTPGAHAVMGRTESATDNISYSYGSEIILVDDGYELFINTFGNDGTDGLVICSVDYGAEGFSSPSGKSIQLNPTVKDANEAKLGANWCVSTQQYSTGDYGTPGLENTSCE